MAASRYFWDVGTGDELSMEHHALISPSIFHGRHTGPSYTKIDMTMADRKVLITRGVQ